MGESLTTREILREYEPGNPIIRSISYGVDLFVSFIGGAFLSFLFLEQFEQVGLGFDLIGVQIILMGSLILGLFESSEMKSTPGKRLFGLVVLDLAGRKITLMEAVVRNLVKAAVIFLFPPAVFVAYMNRMRRMPWDWAAGTIVCLAPSNQEAQGYEE